MGQPTMRAKFMVQEVSSYVGGHQKVSMLPVQGTQYGSRGENEDNTFSRYTPSGEIRMQISNPDLIGKIQPGDVYHIDFTKSE